MGEESAAYAAGGKDGVLSDAHNRGISLISIITVTFHSEQVIQRFLDSLATVRPWLGDSEVLIHDNTAHNIGLSKAVNSLLSRAKGDLVLLCNPDIIFNASIFIMLDYIVEHPNTGVIPDFLNTDGSIQRTINRRYPTITRILFDFTFMGRKVNKIFPWISADYCYSRVHSTTPWRVEQPGGSCLLLSRQTIDKLSQDGYFYDEHFPVLWNDVDLAMRARDRGIQFVLVPGAKIVHVLAHSTRTSDPRFIQMLFYSRAGFMGFAKKWGLRARIFQLAVFIDIYFIIMVKMFKLIQKRGHVRQETTASKVLDSILYRFRCTLT